MGYLDELMKESKKTGKELKKATPDEKLAKVLVAKKQAMTAKKPAKPPKLAAQPKKVAAPAKPVPVGLPAKPTPKPAAPAIPLKEEAGEVKIIGKKTLVTSYGNVKIYKVEGEPLLVYSVPVIKPAGPEKIILNTIKEAATRLITISPEEIRDPIRRRNFYFQKVKEIIESSPELGVPYTKIDFYAKMVVQEMIGYGLLDELVKDFKLEEIMVLGPVKPVYVFHRELEMMKTNIRFGNDEEILNIIARIAREVNRRVDSQNPMLDARLPDGSRVNATIRPISLEGPTLTIRKFREDPFTFVDLIKLGTIDSEIAAFLWTAVDGFGAIPANILVSGGTSSGKTTTLNVLASFIPPSERIVTIEDTAELMLPVEHWVRFETRPPGLEGTGEITMDVLVKNSLRMRPDRIIVGEIRHAEAFTMFTAMNTGHQGCMGTVHANSADETVIRLLNPPMNVPSLMLEALDLVVVQQKVHDRRKGTIRRITEIAELQSIVGGSPKTQVLYEWEPSTDTMRYTGAPSKYILKLQRYTGMSKQELEKEILKRKKLLENLANKDIRSMQDVMPYIQKYRSAQK